MRGVRALTRGGLPIVIVWALGCAAIPGPIEPPNVSVADVRITQVNLFEQRYGLQLRIQNPNPFSLAIRGMDFKVHLNDFEFARGVSRQAVTIPAYGEELVEVDVISSLWRLFSQVQNEQGGAPSTLRYRIFGGLNLANRNGALPFEYRGELGRSPERLDSRIDS